MLLFLHNFCDIILKKLYPIPSIIEIPNLNFPKQDGFYWKYFYFHTHRPMNKNYINIINYYIVFVNPDSYTSIVISKYKTVNARWEISPNRLFEQRSETNRLFTR